MKKKEQEKRNTRKERFVFSDYKIWLFINGKN